MTTMDDIKNNVYYQLGACERKLEEAERELKKTKAFITMITSEIEEAVNTMDKWDASNHIKASILQKLKDYE